MTKEKVLELLWNMDRGIRPSGSAKSKIKIYYHSRNFADNGKEYVSY